MPASQENMNCMVEQGLLGRFCDYSSLQASHCINASLARSGQGRRPAGTGRCPRHPSFMPCWNWRKNSSRAPEERSKEVMLAKIPVYRSSSYQTFNEIFPGAAGGAWQSTKRGSLPAICKTSLSSVSPAEQSESAEVETQSRGSRWTKIDRVYRRPRLAVNSRFRANACHTRQYGEVTPAPLIEKLSACTHVIGRREMEKGQYVMLWGQHGYWVCGGLPK